MNEREGYEQSFREFMLEGRTGAQYLVDEIRRIRDIKGNLIQQGYPVPPVTPFEVAENVSMLVDKGLATEADIETALPNLGLTGEEATVFLTETLPTYQRLATLKAQKVSETAEQNRRQYFQRFNQQWGLSRINEVAQYLHDHSEQLTPVDSHWPETIQRYQADQPQLASMLENVTNPIPRAQMLMRQIYLLTSFRPEEILEVHEREMKTDSRVDLGSILNASLIMRQTDPSESPDFNKPPSLPFRIAVHGRFQQTPEMKIQEQRTEALNTLTFTPRKVS